MDCRREAKQAMLLRLHGDSSLFRANGPSVYIAQAECLGSVAFAIIRAKGPTVCRASQQRAGPLALTVLGYPSTQSVGLGYANGGALPLRVNVRTLVTAQRNKVAESPWSAAPKCG